MAELQHSQIKKKLTEQVAPLIDASDISEGPGKTDHVLSRAIAAICIRIKTDIDINAAVNSVVDGGNDNGIDAIYFDTSSGTLIISQSKWSNSAGSSIDSASTLKFIQGVRDLIAQKKERFNNKIKSRWISIEDALGKANSVLLLIGYPGSSQLDPSVEHGLKDFVSSQNDTGEMFSYEVISQKKLFQYFVHEAAPPQIDLTVNLSHYGLVEHPLRAVYGQVSVKDVSDWYKSHGNNLFAKNIRSFLGLKSEVNSAIIKTLIENPLNFWYFNNGLTILAESYKKLAIGSADRSVGVFECKGVTIVNGAQTVGTIGRTDVSGSDASLQARIIIVEDPSSPIAQLINRASNTQNKIDARNFVALDVQQERIRTELLIEGVNYEYREGEKLSEIENGFDFIEAIIALSCASNDTSYVALAKGYVGELYLDINTTPYKALFNPSTSSKRLWALVKLSRRIEAFLKDNHDKTSLTVKGIITHGNRLLMHCIIKQLEKQKLFDDELKYSDKEIADAAELILSKMDGVLKSDYPDAYLAPLFKNKTKCSVIKEKIFLAP